MHTRPQCTQIGGQGVNSSASGDDNGSLLKNGAPPKCGHTRIAGQSIAGRAPGWSGPSRVDNKKLATDTRG